MYPILPPGSFIQVDEAKAKVVEGSWRSEYERPIYFVETRDGHTCCWCSMRRDEIILQSHPLSPVPVRILRHPQEAEDAVQDAAFAAWRRLGNLHEGSSLRPWFLGIVANRCRAVKRNKWWSVSRSEPPEGEAPATDLASSIDLRRALRRISYDERLVVVLRYYLDMPYDEIAATLGISPKAARTRVERALHRLRPIMRVQGATV